MRGLRNPPAPTKNSSVVMTLEFLFYLEVCKASQGWIRTAAEPTAACGGNREARLGPRSDFSRPRQGAAEKSANATRKALTARFRRSSQPVGMSTGRTAAKIENPNLFSIGEGFGFFVFFGNENKGSSLTAVCPKPYQKKDRITKVTTVKVP